MALSLGIGLGLTHPLGTAGASPPAGFGWLMLNAKFLTFNGKRLMMEHA